MYKHVWVFAFVMEWPSCWRATFLLQCTSLQFIQEQNVNIPTSNRIYVYAHLYIYIRICELLLSRNIKYILHL